MRHALLVALALCLALPAEAARARKKRLHKPAAPAPARAEDDPRKKGDSPAFAKASIAFAAPADLAEVDEVAPVRIQLHVTGYALGALQPGGPVPHAHLIVDNEPAVEVDDISTPLELAGLSRGPHLLRAVLCRPWHEVVKAPRAFAMVRFWVGQKLEGKAGKAAEFVAWPDPKKPILTYVLPVGEPAKDAPPLKFTRDRQQPPDAADPEVETPLEPLQPGADRPVLDFYLAHGRLARRGDKLRIVLDRRELPLIVEWKPQHLRRAHRGAHRVTIDLLNRRGLTVKNAVNRTDRTFNAP
ncbi:MAG TPA: hypothetical protein VFP52_13590 [Myxococcales bacterium]|nr:hypothetical protein [Myxococcales bacterium]HET9753998.1 hypothetical protein [Myxococcales bacterium]